MGTLITHLQIFVIGFTFGIAGPCLLVCTPPIITYIAGTKKKFKDFLGDIIIFLTGRLSAYLALGYLAGLSAGLIRAFAAPQIAGLLRSLGGVTTVALGILVLFYKEPDTCECKGISGRIPPQVWNFGGVFTLGFFMGIMPCAPLLALLFEIVLMSKSGLEGASYALSFGLGTFLSGLIVITALASFLTVLPAKLLKSKVSKIIFKIACAIFLMILGFGLIL